LLKINDISMAVNSENGLPLIAALLLPPPSRQHPKKNDYLPMRLCLYPSQLRYMHSMTVQFPTCLRYISADELAAWQDRIQAQCGPD
jgi:hypothetical protein